MANFFLIDQSLTGVGAHHLDFTRCIAQSAHASKFYTTIGTNRKFKDIDLLSPFGEVKTGFRNTTYSKYSYLASLCHMKQVKNSVPDRENDDEIANGLLDMWSHRVFHSNRRSIIRQFAFDCERFFHNHLLTEHDHAFLTGVSELELMGLAAFLANHPRTLQVKWHLLFHFNLLDGRTPEYEAQRGRKRLVRLCFEAALARVPYHRVNFYATTDELTAQYDQLSLVNFQTLTYPHNPEFFGIPDRRNANAARPLKVSFAGSIRREKGQVKTIQKVVDGLWDKHLATGEAMIIVQRSKPRWPRRSKLRLTSPQTTALPGCPIEYLDHPIETSDYINFIRNSDIGVLPYDSRTYFSRRAGVMGEYLACGIPVVVPSGCWMSQQLARPMRNHIKRLVRSANSTQILSVADMDIAANNVPSECGIVSFDGTGHPFRAEFCPAKGTRAIVISFDWHFPIEQGTFCRIDVSQIESSETITRQIETVGIGDDGRSVAMFEINDGVERVELQLSNAFDNAGASVKNVELTCLAIGRDTSIPRSAVGVVANDTDGFSTAIDEIIRHYDHYKRTAEAFAPTWQQLHDPRETVAELTMSRTTLSKVA